jgi:hypothetical protein
MPADHGLGGNGGQKVWSFVLGDRRRGLKQNFLQRYDRQRATKLARPPILTNREREFELALAA